MDESLVCDVCGTSQEDRHPHRCLICFKKFCEDCGVVMSGRTFCSRFCGEYFFFGGEDDI